MEIRYCPGCGREAVSEIGPYDGFKCFECYRIWTIYDCGHESTAKLSLLSEENSPLFFHALEKLVADARASDKGVSQ